MNLMGLNTFFNLQKKTLFLVENCLIGNFCLKKFFRTEMFENVNKTIEQI